MEFIGLLMKYVNLFSYQGSKAITSNSGVTLTVQQWQVLGCIGVYGDKNKNMVYMANKLGMQKSTFSKYVKLLVDKGLVDRYQSTNNRKDIVLKPSKKGLIQHQERSRIIFEAAWQEPFAVLEKLSDENLAVLVDFMSKMVADLEPENNKVLKLFRKL